MLWVMGEHVIVEVLASHDDAGETGQRIDNQSHWDQEPQGFRRQHLAGVINAVDQGVKNEGGCEQHPGLEPATGSVVAVKLNVKRE